MKEGANMLFDSVCARFFFQAEIQYNMWALSTHNILVCQTSLGFVVSYTSKNFFFFIFLLERDYVR